MLDNKYFILFPFSYFILILKLSMCILYRYICNFLARSRERKLLLRGWKQTKIYTLKQKIEVEFFFENLKQKFKS